MYAKKLAAALTVAAFLFLLVSCDGGGAAVQDTTAETQVETEPEMTEIVPGSIYSGDISVLMPEASGVSVFEEKGVTVDMSNTRDGYVMIKCVGETVRLKARISKGEEMYTYDLNNEGKYEVYPLQMGNGDYEIKIFKNIEGTNYSTLCRTEVSVNMENIDSVYLHPSQYIWYTNDKNAIKLSYDICDGIETDEEKVEKIYDYIVWLLSYDYDKAESVQNGTLPKGYIPDVDSVLETKKGICFDYSALFASMLRAQNIPVRLVMGYVRPDNIYHAWNQVYVNGAWVWMDSTFGPDAEQTENDYTQDKNY